MHSAIIFDMDGVIIDSNPYHKIALKQFCEKYSYQLTDEELINKIYGRTNKEWIPALFNKTFSPAELSRYGEEKEQIFRDIYKNDIRPVDGLISFLEKLAAHNIPAAIGTSAPGSNVDFVLEKTGIRSYFSAILDESDVSNGKPNPEIYLKAAHRLNFDPAHCVVFEDSISGVLAGLRAGSKVVGITTTHSAAELENTDLVIDNFIDLDPVKMLNSLFKA